MNLTIILPNTHLSITEWMTKHKVSTLHTSSELAISRAIDSQSFDNFEFDDNDKI